MSQLQSSWTGATSTITAIIPVPIGRYLSRDGAALSPGTACGIHQQIGVAQPRAGLQAAGEEQHGCEGRRREEKVNPSSPFRPRLWEIGIYVGRFRETVQPREVGTVIPRGAKVHLLMLFSPWQVISDFQDKFYLQNAQRV